MGSGDFTPTNVVDVIIDGENKTTLNAYAKYDTNTNGAIKVLAYTDASNTKYHFGVVKSYNFRDYDNDHAITLVGDDTVYELNMTTTAGAKADYFIVYTLSGEKIKPIYAYGNDHI